MTSKNATPQSPTPTPVTHETLMQDLESLGKSIDKLHDTNAALQAENAELRAMLKGELLERGDERRYTRDEIKQALARAEEGKL
jgi:regulator of replication initiation timing